MLETRKSSKMRIIKNVKNTQDATLARDIEKIENLAYDNPAMRRYLERHDITDVLDVSDKSALFFVDGEKEYYTKYFIDPRQGKKSRFDLYEHTIRSLGCQLLSRHIPGVQGIEHAGFHENIRGLLRMEYVKGRILDQPEAIAALQDPWKIAELFIGLNDTIEAYQHLGIVHKDIKPGNIIHSDRGELAIIDWDNAATFQRDKELREDGVYVGTLGYAHWDGVRNVDMRAAGLTMLQTVFPGVYIYNIYMDEKEFLKEHWKGLRGKNATLADLFQHFMVYEPAYDIPAELTKNTSEWYIKLCKYDTKVETEVEDVEMHVRESVTTVTYPGREFNIRIV